MCRSCIGLLLTLSSCRRGRLFGNDAFAQVAQRFEAVAGHLVLAEEIVGLDQGGGDLGVELGEDAIGLAGASHQRAHAVMVAVAAMARKASSQRSFFPPVLPPKTAPYACAP